MSIKLICLDADDTLWHNERNFRAAEADMLEALSPIAPAKVVREHLAMCVSDNLAAYGYGVKGFTLSMVEVAARLAGPSLPAAVALRILEVGRDLLRRPVELFDGAQAAVEQLSQMATLAIVTKGDLMHQEAKIATSGLGTFVDKVEIVTDKSAETFRQVISHFNVLPEETLVVGDSLRSDIHPALEAGAWAAYILQEGAWAHEVRDVPEGNPRFVQLPRLADVPGWLADRT